MPTAGRRRLGRQFGWLWAAFAVSTFGTYFAFEALPLVAILALHAGTTKVSMLAAAGLAVGAVLAVPLGPWVEFRRKRPVMIAMDLVRFVALISIPVAYLFGRLGFTQLLLVSIIAATADITFRAASGAYLKTLVQPEDLLVANGRFETTTWTSILLGPPLGGAAIGLFGPVTTVLADAGSYLLSALGLGAIGKGEPHPGRSEAPRLQAADLLEGWRYILSHRTLRGLFVNDILVGALILATSPLLAVLMLERLGFAPWQYALAFAAPCIGGLVGSRLAHRLVERMGQHKVIRVAGTLRVCWPIGLAFIRPGVAGLVLVMVVELAVITCMGVYNPVFATYRLEHTENDRLARTLSAWSVTKKATIAAITALWGLLATATSPRIAIAIAGLLLLPTALLLPRHDNALEREPARGYT